MIEQICEESELLLVKVKIYESGGIFRANLYLTGRKEIVLRNFRASDAIALATFYNIPILVRKNLLQGNHSKHSSKT
jgi:bifunctional DNase/RNase